MKWSIHAKMVLGFALPLIILGVIAALGYRSATRLIEDNRAVARSFEMIEALEGTRSAIVSALSAQRGYMTTGDESLLESYHAAAALLEEHFSRLTALSSDNTTQRRRIELLRSRIADRFATSDRMVEERKARGSEPAPSETARGPAQAQGAEIRRIIDEMVSEERRQVQLRIEASEASTRTALVAGAILISLTLVLIGSVYYLFGRDVAERKRVEAALRKSQERFELAVQGSRDGLWDWELATDEVYFSPRWKAQLGLEDREVRNRFEEWEARLHPDDHDRAMATVRAYLAGQIAAYELEHRLRHKDGTYRWILARGVALRDASGKPYRMAGSHTDITARKEAEQHLAEQNRLLEESARSEREALEALKQAQSRLVQQEKLAGLGQMVAGVAHEINNPLAFVSNNVSVLQRDVGEIHSLLALYEEAGDVVACQRPELHGRIRALRESVDMDYTVANISALLHRSLDGLRRIQRIVKDLRLFARLDEGDVKEADLNAGVESTANIILGNARRKQVQLVIDLGDLPPVTCNHARLHQVVMNLLSNAIDACSEGDTVTLRTRAEPSGVQIVVADTGSGIDPKIRDRIFDPFFTTKPVGKGTGLGLSISYGIVREHGGTIEVESTPGQGSCITIHLPLRPAPGGPASA